MEQVEPPGSESPQPLSSAAPPEGGVSGTHRKRRRKEARPESIIVYRSEGEERGGEGEEPGGEGEVPERSQEEEEAKFLSTPTSEGAWSLPPDSRYVTLTGTITRGKKKGQVVDIHVTLTNRELREMAKSKERLDAECEAAAAAGGSTRRGCGLGPSEGPHVVLWSLACAPVVFLLSFVATFYYGTLAWYNVFLVYNEERTFWHKVTVCPALVVTYPPLIVGAAAALALYAAAAQVSWALGEWWRSARDLEKGFCGWACGRLGLEECSPYSVVELLDSDVLAGSLRGGAAGGGDAQTSAV